MTNDQHLRLTRRAFLSFAAAAGAAACTGPVVEVRRSPSESRTDRALAQSPPSTASPVPQPSPLPGRYEPHPADTYRNAKQLAGRFVSAMATNDGSGSPAKLVRQAAGRRLDDTFDVAAAAEQARLLLLRGVETVGEVVYPQLGGLVYDAPQRCCVMVVVRQRVVNADRDVAEAVTRTVDVRLINRDDTWMLEELADGGGAPVDRSGDDLPKAARQVLDDSRIELPDTARWDILRGDIDDRLLTTMHEMAELAPYAVAVLKTGHPRNVFGTDLLSGHTLGRGVDIWRVAGQPVVLQQPAKSSDAYGFTKSLLEDLDVPELGSPWDLDGPPELGELKPSFTDPVHADHIHVAFKAA